MKIHKFADKKKELIGIVLIAFIVIGVSIYVIHLVNGLTTKVYRVFGQPSDSQNAFTHFDFEKFEELGLRPKRVTSTPAVVPASTTPSVPSTTTASGTASSS
jgi:hypothetical protein